MIRAKVNIRDLNRMSSKFRRLQTNLKREVAGDLSTAAINVDRGAKERAPVDEGRLRASIYFEKRRSNGLLWEVGAKVKYAPYMEFGTGRKVNLNQLRAAGFPESFAAQFRGRGIKQVNIRPQPFLFPSVNEETPKLYKRIKKTLQKNGKAF